MIVCDFRSLRTSQMGTFTYTYFFRKAIWEHKYKWMAVPFIYYFGQCWEAAGYHKAQMMKGHSKMYADRIAAIPPGEDVWRY
uniref:Uncharacterized protein n=2 Tax=Parascaris univalens TaxID=6257 RepID=A0A915BE95_PARUN